MSKATRILLAEDSDRDAELVVHELQRSGLQFESRRVQSEAEFRRALDEFRPQIILSDFAMPGFGGVAALRICKESGIEVPFIFVSGTIGEDVAVEAMKAGADDYVMKTNLIRLGPTVQRALREAGVLRDRRVAETALHRSELRYRAIFESAAVGIAHTSIDGRFMMVNPRYCEIAGYTRDEILALTIRELTYPDDIEERIELRSRLLAGTIATYERETRLVRKDRSLVWTNVTASVVRDADFQPQYFISVLQDISERKRAEENLRRFKIALDNSADIILLIDRATMRHVDINQTACTLLGYTREELLCMGPQDTLPASKVDLEKAYDELIAHPSQPSGMQSNYICKDGSSLPFESTRHVLRSGDTWLIAVISRDIRGRLASEQALRDSEVRFRQTFELAASGIAHVTLDGRFLRVNRKLCQILGYAEDELIGRSVKDISHPDDRDVTDDKRAKLRAGEFDAPSFEKRYLGKDGSVVWVSLTVALARDAAGNPEYEISVIEDITERMRVQRRIERLTRIYAVLSGINSLLIRVHDRNELFREACRIAITEGKFVVARVVVVDSDGTARIAATTEADSRLFQQIVDEYNTDPEHSPSLLALALRSEQPMVSNDVADDPRIPNRAVLTKSGTYALALIPFIVEKRAAGVLVLRAREAGMFDEEEMKLLRELAGDIAFALDHIEKANRLDYLAYYDQLTGLANRMLFQDRLTQHIHTVEKSDRKLAVVVADIERFRMVNDSLGRQAGDALLKEVARRLALAVDQTEIARIGADQFAIVLPEMKGRSEIGRTLENIWHRCLDVPFMLDDTEIRIALKGGISLFPSDGNSAEALFRNAEAAWRNAKRKGERYLFHAQEMTERIAERLTLENKLRQAIEKEEFVLHYQPKVNLDTRRIVGVEALIRWQSPERGLVPPAHFVPLLEETGLILQVGAWALQRAVLDHHRWLQQGVPTPRIAVNVSQIQMQQRDFVDVTKATIAQGADPTGIDLEITESLLMEDVAGNITKLKAVCDLGMKIAIDDFGTGYSSLGYLAQLPVHTLKIDRSFIMKMLADPNAMTLVQTIISLAHSLRLSVVAEGVEQEDQAKMLRLLRCDEMQGYLFSRPVPFDEITVLLKKATQG